MLPRLLSIFVSTDVNSRAKFSVSSIDHFTKEMIYEVRYLKSSEDMILALAGQFKLFSKCEDHIFT